MNGIPRGGCRDHFSHRSWTASNAYSSYCMDCADGGIMHAGLTQAEHLSRLASDLAPLAGSLASRDTRAALAAAFAALAKLLPGLQESSELLTDLNAMSTTEVSPLLEDTSLSVITAGQGMQRTLFP